MSDSLNLNFIKTLIFFSKIYFQFVFLDEFKQILAQISTHTLRVWHFEYVQNFIIFFLPVIWAHKDILVQKPIAMILLLSKKKKNLLNLVSRTNVCKKFLFQIVWQIWNLTLKNKLMDKWIFKKENLSWRQ